MEQEIREVRYLSDDRDKENPHELVIQRGNNGDWYISVVPTGKKTFHGVRVCAYGGGGADMHVPGLGAAIASAFCALANAHGPGITHKV